MADKVLSDVRTKLKEGVTKVILKQLLDDLREDGVLNEEETESVLEDNTSRADRVRCLTDMVRKKGPNASEEMIARLKQRDRKLYETLSLGSGQVQNTSPLPQPTPPLVQAAQQVERPVSPILIHSTEHFKADILQRKEKEIYKPLEKSGRRRLALLINNVKFDRESMLRRGAEKDEENMETLLKALGYDVVKHRDLSGKEMDQAVKAFSEREEHGMSDSTFVVIMSHGKRDAILGVHWDEASPTPDLLPIDNIYTHLNTKHCGKLLNKPKVILIQACRGGDEGSVWVSDSVPEETTSIESDDIRKEHKEKDFTSLLSCTPDTKCYRHVEKGTFFVQHIVDVFNTYAHEDHIEELFRKVMRCFEEFPRQMVCKDRTTLMKNFYLFPGL